MTEEEGLRGKRRSWAEHQGRWRRKMRCLICGGEKEIKDVF